MRSFLELLQTHVSNEFEISHHASDFFEKNRYYVKKNNGQTIAFLFESKEQGLCLKIITMNQGRAYVSSSPMYNLTENEYIDEIVRYCGSNTSN